MMPSRHCFRTTRSHAYAAAPPQRRSYGHTPLRHACAARKIGRCDGMRYRGFHTRRQPATSRADDFHLSRPLAICTFMRAGCFRATALRQHDYLMWVIPPSTMPFSIREAAETTWASRPSNAATRLPAFRARRRPHEHFRALDDFTGARCR